MRCQSLRSSSDLSATFADSLYPIVFPLRLSRVLYLDLRVRRKKASEAYWAGKISAEELQKVAKEQRLQRWQTLQQQGVEIIPS